MTTLVLPDDVLEPGVNVIYASHASSRLEPTGSPSHTYPLIFVPPDSTDTPETLFAPGLKAPPRQDDGPLPIPHERFVRQSDPDQIILWTDGFCLRNGGANPIAGYAVKYRPSANPMISSFACRLENEGPDQKIYTQTSNRAELRAVIAALCFRQWQGEGWNSLVIATNSEYVAVGATAWVKKWESNKWRTRGSRTAVKNRDLWGLLLRAVRRLDRLGVQIFIWRIPRDLNQDAHQAAKEVASDSAIQKFIIPSGIMCGYNKMAIVQLPWTEAIRDRPYLNGELNSELEL